jgi:hypothetical protein
MYAETFEECSKQASTLVSTLYRPVAPTLPGVQYFLNFSSVFTRINLPRVFMSLVDAIAV